MSQPQPPAPKRQPQAARNVLLGLLVCGVLLVGIFATVGLRQALNAPTPTPTPPEGVTPMDPPRDLADFTLPGSNGQPLSLSDLQGKYTLMFFGYTHCPDYCPLTLGHWKNIKAQLADAADDMNWLFVSVDGARDTPDVMARFLSRFDPSFIGMTGDDATLAKIGPAYGLYYELHTEEGPNYSVDHTTQSYLLNPKGQMIDVFDFSTTEGVIVQTIQNEMARAATA